MDISRVILHDEPRVPEIAINKQIEFLQETLQIDAGAENSFFDGPSCAQLDGTRVSNLKKPFAGVKCQKDMPSDVMYDGFELQQAASHMVQADAGTLHVIFTDKLIGTFSDDDRRYHARAIIAANPAVISTAGIVEAPAKPKKMYLESIGEPQSSIEQIRSRYRGQFLEYHDPRMSDVIGGYLLQAVFYLQTGEAFCEDKRCRLYNAHWQSELLESQLGGRLCPRHQAMLKSQ